MSLWLIIAWQAAVAAPPASFDLAAAARQKLSVVPRCGSDADAKTIIVCGDREDRYRLPLPAERAPADQRERSDAGTGSVALTPPGPCGIFAGQRRCNKRDAAEFGYGRGRDPVTLLWRLANKALDPDAD